MEKTLTVQVRELEEMTVGALVERYEELFGEEPRSRNRQHLFKQSLIKAETPHQRLAMVEQIQWDYLDEHAGPDPFDFRVILAYLLKLEILERQLALSEDKGMEKVRRLGGL